MKNFENSPRTNAGERGSIERAGEVSWTQVAAQEKQAEEIERLQAQLKNVDVEIAGLEADLWKGSAKMMEGNPKLRELAAMLKEETKNNLDKLNLKKAELEEHIRSIGGNPSDATIQ